MNKHSILILLIYSLFLEIHFEKMFPFVSIVLGLILGISIFIFKKIKDKTNGLKIMLFAIFHIIKYTGFLYVTIIYLVFIDYLRVSYIVSTMYYATLAMITFIIIGLDILDLFKWYKEKAKLKAT